MSKLLTKTMESTGYKFNKDIAEGMSRKYMEKLPQILDIIFNSAMTTLPKENQLEYLGYRRLTPQEDFENNINSSMTKGIVDISRNYLYKLEFKFKYEKTIINRIMALPYVDRGGYLRLSDAHYSMSMVLSEYPVSPAPGELFIRVLRDKLNIKKMYKNILVNDEIKSIQIIYAKTYKLIDKVNDVIPIALYSMVKYGFYEVFKRLFNVKPILLIGDNLNTSSVEDEYNVYTTTGRPPTKLHRVNYTPHSIRILVKKTEVTPLLETYVASLLYSFDMSPLFAMDIKNVVKETKPITTNFNFTDIDDESLFWISLLGRVIFRNKFTLDRVQVDILEHINILNGYLDSIVQNRLKNINIDVDDFYDLLDYCLKSFNELVMQHESYSSKLENRYLDLPYYVLYDTIVAINKAFLEIKRAGQRNRINALEVTRIMNRFLFSKKVFRLIKSTGVNLVINPIDSSTDSLYWKMSSILED